MIWAISVASLAGIGVAYLVWSGHTKQQRVAQEKAHEAERKKREHDAWLLTPQGRAWQEEEREKQRRLQEEETRRRREAEESAARAKWRLYHDSMTMDQIARLTGRQFEEFLARLFARMGYRNITLTATNDQGGDLLCLSPGDVRTVIQAKRWQGGVGNGAVQEVYAAMALYKCAAGMVVTNSTFTAAAYELAAATAVVLHDKRWLEEQIKRFLPPEVPEFNWEAYNRVVKDWQPPRALATTRPKFRRY